MRRRLHDTNPHVTGKGFVVSALAVAAIIAMLALFDDTRWIDRHEAATRAAIEAAR